MKKLMVITISIIILAAARINLTSAYQTDDKQQLLRTVKGQVLTSTEMPAVRLKFDDKFKYAGGQSFILYDVARAEQHFFVDSDKDGRVKRLYWVQFEGYLPSNNHTYKYQANNVTKIGTLDFIADAYARKIIAGQGRPNSDGSRAQSFLESKGYRLEGTDAMLQRLVHLVDESKRNELMIIYVENLDGTGITAADLAPNGSAAARWEEMRKGLLERATKGVKISS
jgi:hypothetical protein